MKRHFLRRRPFGIFGVTVAQIRDDYLRRRVAETCIGHGKRIIRVSTVALLSAEVFDDIFGERDTDFDRFETMIRGGVCDDMRWNYATREAAQVGHREVVKLVRITAGAEQQNRERHSRMHATYRAKRA